MKTRKWGRLPFVVQDHAWDLGITQHPHYADYLNRRDKPTQSFDGERLDFSAMEKMCKKSQVNYLRFNILNLNNSVYSRSGVWLIIIFFFTLLVFLVFFFQVTEQTSHKIIEKRRRDRINSCLSELSQTVPAAFSKQVRIHVYEKIFVIVKFYLT